MTFSRARTWQQLMKLSPLCSGSLHEQYLPCGKAKCCCHEKDEPEPHGPYYLWVRRIGGKQVNRTLKPGAELEGGRKGISNYRMIQELVGAILTQEEGLWLERGRAAVGESKKNFKKRLQRR